MGERHTELRWRRHQGRVADAAATQREVNHRCAPRVKAGRTLQHRRPVACEVVSEVAPRPPCVRVVRNSLRHRRIRELDLVTNSTRRADGHFHARGAGLWLGIHLRVVA